jgi:hypothetical protein
MAPRLLRYPVVLAGLLLVEGCVLPLQFDEEADAGLDRNYPPNIVSSQPDMPGFTTIEANGIEDYRVTVEDKDLGDRLFVRVFRDYLAENPDTPKIDTLAEPGGERARQIDMQTVGWCAGSTPGQRHTFEILISDRPWLASSVPPRFKAVPEGAETTRGFWVVTCQ